MIQLEALLEENNKLKEENKLLIEKNNLYRLIFDKGLDAIITLSKDYEFIDYNHAAAQLLHLDESNVNKYTIHDFLSLIPQDITQFQMDTLQNSGFINDEWIMLLEDGVIKHVEFSAVKLDQTKFGFVLRDISANKALEREHNLSISMFSDVFNRAVDGMVIFDGKGVIIDVNPSLCKSLYSQKETLVGKNIQEFIEEKHSKKLKEMWVYLKKNGRAKGDLPLTHCMGKSHFEITTSANIYNGYYMAIMRDVTEKMDMELKLKENEELFKDLFEQSIDAIIFWESTGRIIKVNEAACRIFECSFNEILKKNLADFIYHKEDKYQSLVEQLHHNGSIREELKFYMPNGQKKQLEFTAKFNSVDGLHMAIFRNVSERYRMEKELRESEEKFRKVFEDTLDGMMLWNNDFQVVDVNRAGMEILEMEKNLLIGKEMKVIFDKNFIKKNIIADHFSRLLYNGEDHNQGEVILHNGKKKYLEFFAKKNINPNLNLTVFRDITEKVELEERLRKSDTLTVVGELAAGIAHEIRNPMTALKGFIQLLENSTKEDHSMYFHVITSELQRIESIITEFLILAKPQAVHYLEKNISLIMKETLDLLSAQAIMHNIQFVTKFANDLPNIFCEPNQLKQVFINMIKNAIEVMPKGGFITITILNVDEKIKISIKDQGCGISSEKIKRLGEPFYTTKERGTGLGLMVSYKIIKEHNGLIEVESEKGEGTAFHIYLPYSKEVFI